MPLSTSAISREEAQGTQDPRTPISLMWQRQHFPHSGLKATFSVTEQWANASMVKTMNSGFPFLFNSGPINLHCVVFNTWFVLKQPTPQSSEVKPWKFIFKRSINKSQEEGWLEDGTRKPSVCTSLQKGQNESTEQKKYKLQSAWKAKPGDIKRHLYWKTLLIWSTESRMFSAEAYLNKTEQLKKTLCVYLGLIDYHYKNK